MKSGRGSRSITRLNLFPSSSCRCCSKRRMTMTSENRSPQPSIWHHLASHHKLVFSISTSTILPKTAASSYYRLFERRIGGLHLFRMVWRQVGFRERKRKTGHAIVLQDYIVSSSSNDDSSSPTTISLYGIIPYISCIGNDDNNKKEYISYGCQ